MFVATNSDKKLVHFASTWNYNYFLNKLFRTPRYSFNGGDQRRLEPGLVGATED